MRAAARDAGGLRSWRVHARVKRQQETIRHFNGGEDMELISSPVITTLLALAIYFLGLSVVVQVFQELWKYLTKSQTRTYRKVLDDYFGSIAGRLITQLGTTGAGVRGPFQFRVRKPRGVVNKLDQPALVAGLEQLAPAWIRKSLDALKAEVAIQAADGGTRKEASPAWRQFLKELSGAERGMAGFDRARDIARFLEQWEHAWHTDPDDAGPASTLGSVSFTGVLNAPAMLAAFKKEFLEQVERAENQFKQLESNFDYAYRRRNTRQTFIIAFLIAVACNIPFDMIYKQASSLPPDQVVAMAETSMELYHDYVTADSSRNPGTLNPDSVKAVITAAFRNVKPDRVGAVDYLISEKEIQEIVRTPWMVIRFIVGCLITALFVCFGAPFWNSISSMLLAAVKARKSTQLPAEGGDAGRTT